MRSRYSECPWAITIVVYNLTDCEKQGQDQHTLINAQDVGFEEDVDDDHSVYEFLEEWCQKEVFEVQQ